MLFFGLAPGSSGSVQLPTLKETNGPSSHRRRPPGSANKTVEEYRQLAEKCREIARAVSAENERIELLARAHTWDLIADRIWGTG